MRYLTQHLASSGLVWLMTAAASYAQFGPAPVAVSEVVEEEVVSGQTFVGTVMPLKKAVIGSAVDGRVVEFAVNEGDRVQAMQPLAQLLTETINLELEAAKAELELRKHELAELKNGTRAEEIEQARARMEASKALTEYTNAKYARAKNLFDRGRAVTEEELQETLSVKHGAVEKFLENKAAHELALAGPRPEKIAQAQAMVNAQQAQVEKLSDQIKKHTIIARFAGYVTAEHTEEGAWVSRGDPVAEVVALDEVEVQAAVLENHVTHLRLGMEVRVEVPSLPDQLFTGVISRIVPQADLRARTFPVKVLVKNTITEDGPLLKSGMLARVALPTGQRRQAVLVPKDALVLGGRQPVVYVVDQKSKNSDAGTVRPVPVILGIASGRLIQATGDMKPGQLVVVQGNERLRPQQEVSITRRLKPGQPPGAQSVRAQ